MRRRVFRTLAASCVAGACALAVTSPSSGATPAPTTPFVTLQGEGSWAPVAQVVTWQNDLLTASSPIKVGYVKHGSLLGRQDLAAKTVDFAISGVGFSADELTKVQGGSQGLITAPVNVASLATIVQGPLGDFHTVNDVCDPDDPTTYPNYPNDPPPGFDPTVNCVVRELFTGPIRVPNRNLAAMYLHYVGITQPPLLAWNHPAVLQALGARQIDLFNRTSGPGIAGRADPDEINAYLQTYINTVAPDVWSANAQLNPAIPWDPSSERIGAVSGVARDGAEQQVAQLVAGDCNPNGDCGSSGVAGGLAAAPASMYAPLVKAFPKKPLHLAEMQNANGDWVSPTSESINKAVDAGGDQPLYALTHNVPGAYPLVWVDNLYAPAHGLSVAKTEGLAMLIRYLATSGQKAATQAGEGRLPASLVTKALAAADELVTSNCVGSDRHIVKSSDPGPLAPAGATEMSAIGTMSHCIANVTTPSTTPVTVAPFSTDFGSSLGSPTAVTPAEAATTTASASSGPASSTGSPTRKGVSEPQLIAASKLPLPVPSGPGPDRLATFALGASLYLLVRRPVIRWKRRLLG